MSLPYPNMVFTPFDPLTAEEMMQMVENIEALQDGSAFDNTTVLDSVKFSGSIDGWVDADESWTYASADDPTFTLTISGDKTGKYSAGMKVKLDQTSTKYFIITKVEYSSPNTTLTLYGGTDYDLANAAITNPYYSTQKAPLGFPMNPTKWTVSIIDANNRLQTPSNNTWIKPTGSLLSLDLPIGSWEVFYGVASRSAATTATFIVTSATLSTTTNSETDIESTTKASLDLSSSTYVVQAWLSSRRVINLASKTTYNLLHNTNTNGSVGSSGFSSGTAPGYIKAVCAYL